MFIQVRLKSKALKKFKWKQSLHGRLSIPRQVLSPTACQGHVQSFDGTATDITSNYDTTILIYFLWCHWWDTNKRQCPDINCVAHKKAIQHQTALMKDSHKVQTQKVAMTPVKAWLVSYTKPYFPPPMETFILLFLRFLFPLTSGTPVFPQNGCNFRSWQIQIIINKKI